MNFSQREGHKKSKINLLNEMDDGLKNAIWTEVYKTISSFIDYGTTGYGDSKYLSKKNAQILWIDFFNQSISDFPSAEKYVKELELLYDKLKWYEIFDLIELILEMNDIRRKKNLSTVFNKVLEKNFSPYRIINKKVQPITDKNSISQIEQAFNNPPNDVIKNHLSSAEKLFSQKLHPDYILSCLESIKAVEAYLYLKLKNNKQLSDNIQILKKENILHIHLVNILDKVNAFRGDVTAHGTKDTKIKCELKDAIFFHILCCTFINYLNIDFKEK